MRITFITNPHTCNLNCKWCFSKQAPLNWEKMQEMDFALIEKIVKSFMSSVSRDSTLTEIIPSTIGEPFLYSRFEDFLKLARTFNLKVNVTTNGTFPNGGIEKWTPFLLPVLSDIKFSAMNGEIPNWLRENILTFIAKKNASGFKMTVSIQATIEKNDKYTPAKIAELREFAESAGVDRVKVNEVWFVNSNDIAVLAGGDCPFLGKEAWVWVDGTFQVCPNPDARFGLGTKIPFGDFGNFATQDSFEIWNSERYKKFCENYKENAICKRCRMRFPCCHACGSQ